jgi:hypothetical protein
MSIVGYPEIVWVAGSLLIGLTTLSLICGILAVYLIHTLNRWNRYIVLVYMITVFQLIYDISFYFLIGYKIEYFFQIFTFLNYFGGTAVTLWVNVISFLLLYTIAYLQSFDIRKYFLSIFAVIFTFSFGLAISTVIMDLHYPSDQICNWIYFCIRIVSIIVNVIVYVLVTLMLKPDYYLACFDGQEYFQDRNAANELLILLTNRLQYYPVIQIISRAAAA